LTRLLTLAALMVALYGAPVAAQQVCDLHETQSNQLKSRYGEQRIGFGMSGPAAIVEIWANTETGTWTILVVYPDGMSCLKAAGESWQTDPPVSPGDPA